MDGIPWEKVWLLPNRYLITNKVKEVSFKLIHRFYPAKSYIHCKFKKDIAIDCCFCNACPETAVHLFWNCSHVQRFWKKMCDYIHDKIEKDFLLCWQNVLFGLFESNSKNSDAIYLINLLLLMSKYHIHSCKYSGKKTCFFAFHNSFKQYIQSITLSTKQKAIKTTDICMALDLFT